MEAGKLNKRITIQRRETSRTPGGQNVGKWVDDVTVWADVVCTDSKAADADGVIRHEGLYRFRIRWRQLPSTDLRVIWGKRTFLPVGPPVDWEGQRVGLTLLTKELI